MLRILLFRDTGMACTLYHPTFNCFWFETVERHIFYKMCEEMPKTRTENPGYAQMFHVNCLRGYEKPNIIIL